MLRALESRLERGSLQRQVLSVFVVLTASMLAATALVLASVAASRQVSAEAGRLADLRESATAVAAAQAADSDALRSLELHPDEPAAQARFALHQVDLSTRREQLAARPAPPSLVEARAGLLRAADRWLAYADATALLPAPAAIATDFEGDRLRQEMAAALVEFQYRADGLTAQTAGRVDAANSQVVVFTLAGLLFRFAVIGLLAWLLLRNLRPIRQLVAAAGELATGRGAPIAIAGGSLEVRELAQALSEWQRSLEWRVNLAEAAVRMGARAEPAELLAAGGKQLADALGDCSVSFELEGEPAAEAPLEGPEGTELEVPMVSGGRRLGRAVFRATPGRAPFGPAERRLADVLVAHVAAALHAAQLLADLVAANRHKSEFLAHMSHELRTPLNSILGFAQLLDDPGFGPLNDRQQRYVGHIRSSGGHLLALINDVLDLSKVEAGQLDLQVETFDLGALAAECAVDLRPQLEAKDLELALRVPGELAVRGDRRRVAQVLLNLLSNAIKFTPEGGSVTLAAAEAEGGQVAVTVTDTGIGIAPEALERVFDAFWQATVGRTRAHDGTGLGLALSRRLVELMGGTIGVESQAGAGSTFRVLLPGGPTAAAASGGGGDRRAGEMAGRGVA